MLAKSVAASISSCDICFYRGGSIRLAEKHYYLLFTILPLNFIYYFIVKDTTKNHDIVYNSVSVDITP